LEWVSEHLQAKGLRLSAGTIVDATIINAPGSTKNARQERDPEMHQTRKGKQCGGDGGGQPDEADSLGAVL
jgi:IS5 family transposase